MLGRDRDSNYNTGENSYPGAGASDGTVLSNDAEFKGSLTFKGSLRIDGKFEGEINSPGTVHIGQEGELQAEVNVGNAIIEGKHTGNMTVKDKLELRSTARLFGDIKASRLVINEGVIFVGKCEVNPSNSKIEVLMPESKEQPKPEQKEEHEVAAGK